MDQLTRKEIMYICDALDHYARRQSSKRDAMGFAQSMSGILGDENKKAEFIKMAQIEAEKIDQSMRDEESKCEDLKVKLIKLYA